jgi:drug/metabolite transporter (DMT)-like permease
MDWIFAALGSAIGFAVVTILDKILLERHVPSASTFIVFATLMQIPGALVPLAFVAFPGYPLAVWALALGSGASFGLSLVLMFSILRRQDVSLVTAVFQTAPVFVAIIAVFALGRHTGHSGRGGTDLVASLWRGREAGAGRLVLLYARV